MSGEVRKRHLKVSSSTNSESISLSERQIVKSGSFGKTFGTVFITIAFIVLALLVYAYGTSSISSVVIHRVPRDTDSKWNRYENSNLQNGQRVLIDLRGPESIAVDSQQNWYTGLDDGRLIKIENFGKEGETIRDLSNIVKYTAGGERALKRPLGMRIFQDKLYFADAYQGLFSMDLKTEKWEKVIGYDEVKPPMAMVNDLAISSDGIIYFTDVSSRWHYANVLSLVVEGECSGRIFMIGRQGLRLIKDRLCVPNGIELSFDEKKLVVSENAMAAAIVIDIDSGEVEKEIQLPGGGDNIRRSPNGGYWVPVPCKFHPVEKYTNKLPFLRDIAMTIFGDKLMNFLELNHGTVVKLNDDFEIEYIHKDAEGKVSWAITELQEYQPGKFLLGSFTANGIVKFDWLPS